MSRVVLIKCVAVFFCVGLFYAAACEPQTGPQEPAPKDASDKPEPRPEPRAREAAPDGLQQPAGVGDKCNISPHSSQGTCPNERLLCGGVSSDEAICFENCSANNKCALATEKCVKVRELSQFPVCVTVAKKGDKCGLKDRIICPGEIADPPLFCVEGTCQEKPKDGWGVGQACTPPRGGDDQSDCKAGNVCVEHARNVFLCAKSCKADGDCPSGEACKEGAGYLPKQVCIIDVPIGGDCDKLKRRFCKTVNKLNPATCQEGKCKGKIDLKQIGENCKKSSLPGEKRGDCDQGLVCLGVSDRASVCHKECKQNSDCAGESCATHPNLGPGDPLQACVIPVKVGGECDLQQRKMCAQEANKFFQCKIDNPDNGNTKGKCTEVKIGDGCVNDSNCGRMACIAVDGDQPAKKYCLVRCDPKTPNCPGNGTCNQWGGMMGPFACVPAGPKKEDEVCAPLAAVGEKLNTTTLCTGGLGCIVAEQGKGGVCMKRVAGCAAGACDSAHVCLPLQSGGGVCGLDCSKSTSACKPGTKCTEIASLKAKICTAAN